MQNVTKGGSGGVIRGLPKTGQTVVYQAGDDGAYQKGWVGTRFTDNGDGTITDKATGLMWVKDGTGAGCNGGATNNWANAIIFCEALNFAGYTDWRLPNIKELQSIIDYGRYSPSIDPLFINTFSAEYWSGSTYQNYTIAKWFVTFLDSIINGAGNTSLYYLRPVRGG